MTNFSTEQEKFWAGNFGDAYIDRNKSESLFYSKMAMWAQMLKSAHGIQSATEMGCNIGLNLAALKRLNPLIELGGVEINPAAADEARKLNVGTIETGTILDKINLPMVDLTFSVTVLIHINPEYLEAVYDNLVSLSKKYVLVAEYYNPSPVTVNYRGHSERLYKRDFAGELMEKYNLNLVDYGFVYKRDNIAPQDDITWFLLQKPNT
ncbi:pseudaminic acid biosynthesis-associated methylase [Hirschia litorea]|uniref:Pseudaminic acid biosynthesis-associated methylase n=1 Tax=Hirschia litorea TaxID=1199156 RepID=A0ABW2II40_9PROT